MRKGRTQVDFGHSGAAVHVRVRSEGQARRRHRQAGFDQLEDRRPAARRQAGVGV